MRIVVALFAALALVVAGTGAPVVAQEVEDPFSIAYGDPVSDGVPISGAGNLETAGGVDIYSFEASAGDVAILDVLSGSAVTFRWSLEGPSGDELFDSIYSDRSVELVAGGTYLLTVYGSSADASGAYSFRLLATPPPQEFAVDFGDTVSSGVPAAGAGNVEVPGAVDVYSFHAVSGTTTIFDRLTGPTSGLRWILRGPSGSELFNTIYADRDLLLDESGTYTLSVSGLFLDGTGTYSFSLLRSAAVEDFEIAIGDTVSAGVPEPGAGDIEAPGGVDRYSFDGAADGIVTFDALVGNTGEVRWRLEAPDGSTLFDSFYVDQQVILPQAGSYTLVVEGQGVDGFGVYSFALVEVQPEIDEFAIAIGDVVTSGAPGPGAGEIESPGDLDRYTFQAAAGQTVEFDTLSGPSSGLRWTLISPSGVSLFDSIFSDGAEALGETGTYMLTVSGLTVTSSGTYSFRLGELVVNNDPVASDDTAATAYETPVTIDVLGNDTDPDDDPLAVTSVGDPGNGSASTDGQQVTYAPAAGFAGVDEFTYTISDGRGGTAQASVFVTVAEAPNTAPSIEPIADQENTVGDTIGLTVVATDVDGDVITFTATGLPSGVEIDPATGEITGTITDGAETASPYLVEVAASDARGGHVGVGFEWLVNPLDDDALDVRIELPLACLFINGFGVIPVTIYGGPDFDVRAVDMSSVRMAGMSVQRIFGWHVAVYSDYDGDGHTDVLVLFAEVPGAFGSSNTTATVTGTMRDGTEFAGVGEICLRPRWVGIGRRSATY